MHPRAARFHSGDTGSWVPSLVAGSSLLGLIRPRFSRSPAAAAASTTAAAETATGEARTAARAGRSRSHRAGGRGVEPVEGADDRVEAARAPGRAVAVPVTGPDVPRRLLHGHAPGGELGEDLRPAVGAAVRDGVREVPREDVLALFELDLVSLGGLQVLLEAQGLARHRAAERRTDRREARADRHRGADHGERDRNDETPG